MNQQERMYAFVELWQESGLTKAKFCNQHEISFHQFNYWHKKYFRQSDVHRTDEDVSFFSVADTARKQVKRSGSNVTGSKTMRIDLPGGISITIY